ncbi:MAG: hypothetical protein ACI4MT_04650 [Christensenellales bacterium]
MNGYIIVNNKGQFFMGFQETPKYKRPVFMPIKELAISYESELTARHRVCELNTYWPGSRPYQIISDSINL